MKIYINDHIDLLPLDDALAQLPTWRRRHAMAHRHERDRRLSAIAYLLLWQALQADFGIDEPPSFSYASGGKPSIAGHPELHFNISHCPKAAMCAIGHRPVGVDIETIRPYNEALAKRVLSHSELQAVAAAPHPDEEFARLWTMKESVLKLTGEGIRRELKHVLTTNNARLDANVCPERGYAYCIATHNH